MSKTITKISTTLAALGLLLAWSAPVLADSDITDADYSGIITIANTGTAATGVATNCSINTTVLINGGYLNSGANNTAIRSASGADIAFMPGYAGNPWMLFVPSIGTNNYQSDVLYTGNVSGGKLAYFPTDSGMITPDDDDLELGSYGNVTISGYFNTDVSADVISKTDALVLSTGSGNMSLTIYGSANISQPSTTGANPLDAFPHNTRIGQYLILPPSTLASVAFWLEKDGSPTGTANVTIRNADTDAIITTMGTINVSTIVTGAPQKYTFTSPVIFDATTPVRVCMEYADGVIGNDIVFVGHYNGDVANGYESIYEGAGPGWTDYSTYDVAIEISLSSIVVSASYAVASQDMVVGVGLSNSGMYLLIDSAIVADVTGYYCPSVSMNNTSANWTTAANGSMTYLEYQKITVGGVLKQHVAWDYATTFTDRTGNGNHATPSLRTESTDPDVLATLSNYRPLTEAKAPAFTLANPPAFITNPPAFSSNFSTNITPTYPGAAVIKALADSTTTPVQIPTMTISLFILLVASLGTARLMKQHAQGSLMAKTGIILCFTGVYVALRIWDFWMVFVFLVMATAIMLLSKDQGR